MDPSSTIIPVSETVVTPQEAPPENNFRKQIFWLIKWCVVGWVVLYSLSTFLNIGSLIYYSPLGIILGIIILPLGIFGERISEFNGNSGWETSLRYFGAVVESVYLFLFSSLIFLLFIRLSRFIVKNQFSPPRRYWIILFLLLILPAPFLPNSSLQAKIVDQQIIKLASETNPKTELKVLKVESKLIVNNKCSSFNEIEWTVAVDIPEDGIYRFLISANISPIDTFPEVSVYGELKDQITDLNAGVIGNSLKLKKGIQTIIFNTGSGKNLVSDAEKLSYQTKLKISITDFKVFYYNPVVTQALDEARKKNIALSSSLFADQPLLYEHKSTEPVLGSFEFVKSDLIGDPIVLINIADKVTDEGLLEINAQVKAIKPMSAKVRYFFREQSPTEKLEVTLNLFSKIILYNGKEVGGDLNVDLKEGLNDISIKVPVEQLKLHTYPLYLDGVIYSPVSRSEGYCGVILESKKNDLPNLSKPLYKIQSSL